jgi:hypothetical protein
MSIPNTNAITMYMHCGLCIEEFQAGILSAPGAINEAPRDYARLEIGWTKEGLQVWCMRHECNVMHVDFEGTQHPANDTRIKSERRPWPKEVPT